MRNTRYAPIALLALLVSCSTSEAATTTSTTLATTTTAPTTTSTSTTTTSTTTTVPPTTVPPPPVSSTAPADPAVAEITARLDSLWPAWDTCTADPPACDINSLLNQYFAPGSAPEDRWRTIYDSFVASNQHSTDVDKMQRFVASVDVTGTDAVTEVCQRDGSVTVAVDGSVVDDSVGLVRYEWVWSKVDNRWMIIGGTTYKVTEAGDTVCDAYFI